MALPTYCDYLLYRKAEGALGIYPPTTTTPHTTPTYSQAYYETQLVNQFSTGLTENDIKVAEYRTNCLAGFVTGITAGGVHVTGATIDCDTDIATYTNTSGGTFTLDLSCVGDLGGFWSASSADGSFIVNSAMTTSKVGIGTTVPNHELSVSGTVSASTSVIAPTLYGVTGLISDQLGVSAETQVGGVLILGIGNGADTNLTTLANTGSNVVGGNLIYTAGLGTGIAPPGAHTWYGGNRVGSGSGSHNNVELMNLDSFGTYWPEATTLRLMSSAATSDKFEIVVVPGGETMLRTTGDSTTPDIILSADGKTRVNTDLVVTGNTVMNGTLSATTSFKVGNGDGFISAATIDGPTISADTLYIKNKTVTSASDIGILVGIATDDKVYTATTGTLGVGVSSVDETTPGTSTGTPIVVNPTTGTVLVQPMAYNGTTNIGHVPTGGGATTFLRGDGTWVTPTAGGDSYWSASSADGSFIVNSAMTTSKVGIGTTIPNHELSVSGTMSASTSIFVGDGAGIMSGMTYFGVSGFNSTYIKFLTGSSQYGTYIGHKTGDGHEVNSVYNTAVGAQSIGSLGNLSTAIRNTALGQTTMAYLTSGDHNTAVGSEANQNITTGSENIAIGRASGYRNVAGSGNIAIGNESLYYGPTLVGKVEVGEYRNIAVGHKAMENGLYQRFNTSVGYGSLQGQFGAAGATGSTAIGYGANSANTTGDYNTTLGYQAGDNITTGDYNISIGPDADPPSATADYQMNIGGIIFGNDEYTDSAISQIGIGYNDPKVKLDVHHDPTDLADDTGGGEVIYFGTDHGSQTCSAGKLMYLHTDGKWMFADADSVGSGGSQLLGLCIADSVSTGILIRGFFDLATQLADTFAKGKPCYVGTTTSRIQFTQPAGANDYVRVVGYGTDTANVIYFNPDTTYIKIA